MNANILRIIVGVLALGAHSLLPAAGAGLERASLQRLLLDPALEKVGMQL